MKVPSVIILRKGMLIKKLIVIHNGDRRFKRKGKWGKKTDISTEMKI